MNKKLKFYQKHKFFLQINKSSSEFYASSTYRKFVKDKSKIDISKINSPFTINREYNKDFMKNAHRILLHSKIKSNPKYSKLEIESYICKKEKKISQIKNFFLTSNTFKKTKNKESWLKNNESKNNNINYYSSDKKYKTIYPISTSKIDIKKNYFYSNRNIKEFVNERRMINKLYFINKLKKDLKEKKESEINCKIKIFDLNSISLLKSNALLTKFETDRNYYNRHLLNDLMKNKQILLKIKLKENILEGQITQLKRRIDDLKGKSNALKDYKNFIMSVKNHLSSMDNFFNETIDSNKSKAQNIITISPRNDKNNLCKKNYMVKRNSVLKPFIKKNTFNFKYKSENKKNKTFYQKSTLDNYKEEKQKNYILKKKARSQSEIFETPIEFSNKINKIEDTLIALIYKKNKISRELTDIKIKANEELNSLKFNSNIESKIKMYNELLNNYKDYNNILKNKEDLLLIEKDNQSFYNLVYKKIKQILITINKNFKKLPKYDNIYERLLKLLNKGNNKNKFILEGIILIEKFVYAIDEEIVRYSNNSNEENIIEKVRYKIEKEKQFIIERQNKDKMISNLKLEKILKKMNKIFITSRKVPEKMQFLKNTKYKSKDKSL